MKRHKIQQNSTNSEVLIQILVDSYLIDWFFPQLFKSLLDLGGFRCIAVCWGIISDPILH